MGNQDAMDRLHCYRTALEANHIPYDCTKVVYGNFSESSEEVVRELLDMHPDLEAICFANDKMCIGGYNVFQERGMRVGKDILVTGFDNSEVATSLKPMLTTVRTNISSMGYQSVREMVRAAPDRSCGKQDPGCPSDRPGVLRSDHGTDSGNGRELRRRRDRQHDLQQVHR